MSTPARNLCHAVCLVLIMLLVGGHVAVVQVIGWGSMIGSQVLGGTSVADAVREQVGGPARCGWCSAADALSAGDATTPKSPAFQVKKAEAVPYRVVLILAVPPQSALVSAVGERRFPDRFRSAPDTPPPQG